MNFFCYTGDSSEFTTKSIIYSVLEFSAVETTPLYDVFFRGYIAKVEDQAH